MITKEWLKNLYELLNKEEEARRWYEVATSTLADAKRNFRIACEFLENLDECITGLRQEIDMLAVSNHKIFYQINNSPDPEKDGDLS
ncbi:MAG: hypothetical protein LBK27_02840 [Treponema sp.]|jgi:hypothetical protein|nr:hypothetical protein [Treponema sp.]